MSDHPLPIRGRLVFWHQNEAELLTQSGIQKVRLDVLFTPDRVPVSVQQALGGRVEITNGQGSLLTPNQSPKKSILFAQRILDSRRRSAMRIRAQIELGIRQFFLHQDFLETRTPLLVPCPGMEPHIRPFSVISTIHSTEPKYLPTSPEFAMKQLLVGGLERIFQISSAFRDEPCSITHRPEFTILEWYRAYVGFETIMEDTESLLEYLAVQIFGQPEVRFQNKRISLKAPWPRLKTRDLFQSHAGIDLIQEDSVEKLKRHCERLGLGAQLNDPTLTWDDLYFIIWLNFIEPKLPEDQAVFVTHYPASQAALAVIECDTDGYPWAKRFEVYAGGLELGNAFEELTHPFEQETRFKKDMQIRANIYGEEFPASPIDNQFLLALQEGMPPSGGIAMGVDRLVMLFANENDIDYTFWL